MSTTLVKFNSSGFVATPGITWLQAIYTGDLVNPIDLMSGSGSLTLTDGSVSAQRIYIVGGSGTPQTFTSEGQITANASSEQYRYVIYELNLKNASSDVLDITAENGIGFNASAESVMLNGGTNLFSGSRIPFSSLTSLITSPPIGNTSAVQNGMIFGPNGAPGAGYWPASYWQTYVDNVLATPSVINGMEFGGEYNGNTLYHYRAYATTNPLDSAQQGLMLYPVASTAALPSGSTEFSDWIFVPTTSLVNNINQPGLGGYPVTEFAGGLSGTATTHLMTTTTTTAAIIEEALLASFDAGFYGSFGTSPNPKVTQTLDLNKSWNIGWNYAYQGQLNSGTPSNGTSLGSLAVGSVFNNGSPNGLNSGYYDPYAAMVMQNTNVYAWAYGDYLGTWGGTAPVISLWDPNRFGAGQGGNVSELDFTIYADSTQQPATNFIAPAVGYIAPSGNTFSAATFSTNNTLEFVLTKGNFSPDQNTPITFRIYAPGQQNSDSQGFINLQLNGLFQANGNFSDWADYQITTGSAQNPYTVSSVRSEPSGILKILDVPVVQGGEAWYQFIVGMGKDATTYNVYAVANAGGQFTQMIVDHSGNAVGNVTGNPSLSAPGSGPYADAQVQVSTNYVTYNPAVYSAPHFSRFSDGALKNDVVLGNANSGLLANWTLDGQGNVLSGSGQLDVTALPGWQVAGTGSFGALGSGTTDLLLENVGASGTTQLATWAVSGTTVTTFAPFGSLPLGWSVVGTGDFIGAGQANQILLEQWDQNTNLGQLAFWEVINEGTIAHNGNVGGPLGNGWRVAGVGNILGDGHSDVLLQNGSQLAIWEFNSQGQVTQGASINQAITPGWSVAGLGYFTSSTHEDILFQNGEQLAMWQMQGFDVSNHGNVGAPLQPGWAIAGIGDFNNSGTSDILLQNGNQFVEWLMNGMTVTASVNVSSQLSTGWNLLGTGNLG